MTGTILNAIAILLGALIGLWSRREPSTTSQNSWRLIIGLFAIYAGLSATWQAVPPQFAAASKSILVIIMALMLGNLTGNLLRLQVLLNRLGQYAANRVKARPGAPAGDTFAACTILFCVSPISIVGSLQEGLSGHWETLAVKSAMDGFACLAFARTLGWPVILTLLPLVAWQGTITLSARLAAPWLEQENMLYPLLGTAGLIVFCVSLVILQIKKVELANYLPSLVYAPLLGRLIAFA